MMIILGAIIGATLRFAVYEYSKERWHSSIPTLIVNVLGSLLLGLYLQYAEHFYPSFFITGLLSSFTTFSTFSVDSLKWILNKQWLHASVYIILNVTLCCLAVYIGYSI